MGKTGKKIYDPVALTLDFEMGAGMAWFKLE